MDKSINIFISYSRKDEKSVTEICNALKKYNYTILRDSTDILPIEEWRVRIKKLIASSEIILFCLSPNSIASKECNWELEYSNSLCKTIAPLVIENVEGERIPESLSKLNYIFSINSGQKEKAIKIIHDSITVDYKWLRYKAELTNYAYEWEKQGKPKDLLLRGETLEKTKNWEVGIKNDHYQYSDLVKSFISESKTLENFQNEYNKIRLEALEEFVKPYLIQKIEEFESKSSELYSKSSFRLGSAESRDIDDNIKIIKNFLSNEGRWHPQEAKYWRNAGADADYAELYKFPCCDKIAIVKDERKISQYRADGCQNRP